jgi:uncharacterized membrane protein YwaF
MEQYFALNYAGPPFQLFGVGHIIALSLIVLFCLSFLHLRNTLREGQKKRFRWTLAIILLVNELAWHVCMLLTNNRSLYEISYFLGIGGALQALLTPDITGYGFPHFRAFNTFLAHGLLVSVPIYMTLVEGFRPTLASFKRVFLWTNIYIIPVFLLNLAIGSNYLFIAYKPKFPTLLNLLAPWPWYILELEAVGFLIFLLLYLPFLVIDWRTQPQPNRSGS